MIAALLFAALAAAQVPTFESGVETVSLDVLVTREGTPVAGLSAADFEVRDDGVVQKVSLATGADVGIHAVLALDVSGSVVGQRFVDLKAAARAFLSGLAPRDRVSVLAFNHGSRLAAGPAATAEEAASALDDLSVGGGTALYDATLAGLVLADASAGRPVLAVFSDGENRLSWTTPSAAAEAARASEVVVYGVGAGSLEDGGRKFLGELAEASGGRVWQARDGAELRAAFTQLLLELRGRYLLRFEPQAPRRGWHKLEVKLRPRGEVRARRAYLRR
jgi:VWFA-related protein